MDEQHDVRLDIRIPNSLRHLIRQAAAKADTNFSRWIRTTLEREARRELEGEPPGHIEDLAHELRKEQERAEIGHMPPPDSAEARHGA
jgi:uncharacterized protein (DUF1778 family)